MTMLNSPQLWGRGLQARGVDKPVALITRGVDKPVALINPFTTGVGARFTSPIGIKLRMVELIRCPFCAFPGMKQDHRFRQMTTCGDHFPDCELENEYGHSSQ